MKRINGNLILDIGEEQHISFREEWIEQLCALPYEQYGEFIRITIYPALTDKERKLWSNSITSNRALNAASKRTNEFAHEITGTGSL